MRPDSALLIAAVLLHALLLTLLFLRRAAARLPLFTALIAFYLLRSVLLYALFGRVDDDAYGVWYAALNLLDVVLQICVVWELFRKTRQTAEDGRVVERVALFAVLVLVSAASGWAISLAVPASPHLPLDRAVLFTGVLMLLTSLTAMSKGRAALPRGILLGFGAFGLFNTIGQIGRTLAAYRHSSRWYVRWSWFEAVGYLVVVLFWCAMTASFQAAGEVSETAKTVVN